MKKEIECQKRGKKNLAHGLQEPHSIYVRPNKVCNVVRGRNSIGTDLDHVWGPLAAALTAACGPISKLPTPSITLLHHHDIQYFRPQPRTTRQPVEHRQADQTILSTKSTFPTKQKKRSIEANHKMPVPFEAVLHMGTHPAPPRSNCSRGIDRRIEY